MRVRCQELDDQTGYGAGDLDVVVTGHVVFDERASRLIGRLREHGARCPILAFAAKSEIDPRSISGIDYVEGLIKGTELLHHLERYTGLSLGEPAEILRLRVAMKTFVGGSQLLRRILLQLPRIARSCAPVVITGETGTGKELCARALHYLGARAGRPFVPVNCGALPSELADNELFGHVRGAYTHADRVQQGLVEEADGGTLFLDEVDSLPPAVQVKLLRFLQEGEYRQLGSSELRRSDVRVVAASNRQLGPKDDRLRADLYYRLSTVTVELPPLRQRLEDLPELAQHFLEKHGPAEGRPSCQLSVAALEALRSYDWPGNVRELEHVIRRALILGQGPEIEAETLGLGVARESSESLPFREAKERAVERFERQYVEQMLRRTRGNITRAAELSRKNRRAFFELIRRHNIDVDAFRSPGWTNSS